MAAITTPYDGKIFLWYVYGGMIAETTIDQICRTVRTYAPAVTGLYVKITDGTEWMGRYEKKPDLVINSPADVDRWVQTLNRYGLEFHAWTVFRGDLPIVEASLLVSACLRPGVRSLIIDVEPHPGFFNGNRTVIKPFMEALRRSLPVPYPIGMSLDPRPQQREAIFPSEWRPYINSVLPQAYWGAFKQSPDATLKLVYETWSGYGLPILPVLQGYQVTQAEMDRARSITVRTYNAPSVSWFSFGAIGAEQFRAANVTIAATTPPTPIEQPPVSGQGRFARTVVVRPQTPAYREGTYNNLPNPLIPFQNTENAASRYKVTSATVSTVWARWDPQIREGGLWEISVYIPAQHGSTNNARYKVHGVVGQLAPVEVRLRQEPVDNTWSSLGVFNLSATDPTAGVVFLNDLTAEIGREISFDAVRWRQVAGLQGTIQYLADGFDSPVGAALERRTGRPYPPTWTGTSTYGQRYFIGGDPNRPALQTGIDLVSVVGEAATAHQPVFAAGSGIVVSADRYPDHWGNTIVVRHDPHIVNGQVYYTRYARIENVQVRPGDRVVRGQYICNVSNGFGLFRYHLHFDLSATRILQTTPWDFIGLDEARLRANYTNPTEFLLKNRPPAV